MVLRNQIPAKLSARSVYAKKSSPKQKVETRGRPRKYSIASPVKTKAKLAVKKIDKKVRGRPKKSSVTPVKVKSSLRKKSSPKVRKRKSSVTFKNTTEVIENNSSEADLSSEGEETDQVKEKSPVKKIVQTNSDDNDIENDEESSGEEGDVEDIVREDDLKGNDKNENASDEDLEVDITGDIESEIDIEEKELQNTNDEQNGSDDNALYSFPEFSDQPSTSRQAVTNGTGKDIADSHTSKKKTSKDKIQIKQKMTQETIVEVVSSKKRKISHKSYEEAGGLINEISPIMPKEKRKRLRKEKRSKKKSERIIHTPRESLEPPYHFDPLHHNTSSFRSPPKSPHPKIDSMHSLIRFNKCVPCGNVAAEEAFNWLINPTSPVDFFNDMFEKVPFAVSRGNASYYKDLFSGNDINTMLKEHNLEYGVHIDVVKYVQDTRIPLSAEGRAYSSNVWEDYKQGFSLRIRNPQSYNKNLWQLCTLLQEYFSSTVGCNIYLTPAGAQGFPPHYDDIDAFIVQVEGRKYWKVYQPRNAEEDLARYSSKDFSQNEIGNPCLEVCLNAGQMLYIPRGYIHQAATDGDSHSLHLTFSTNQLNTWGDLLLIATRSAVEKAILSDVTFRESVPKDYMDFLGTSVADSKVMERYELINKVKNLAVKAMSYIDVDEAADQHSIKFIQTALPPLFNKIEKDHSLHGNGSSWKNGLLRMKGTIDQNTKIQLIKKRILRLVISDPNPRLYHTLENQRDPRPVDEALATYVELGMEVVPAYLYLLNKYPNFIRVMDLPLGDVEDKIFFATSLYENGLILTKEPLPHSYENFVWGKSVDFIPPSIVKEETF